jgi:hypothetical protein
MAGLFFGSGRLGYFKVSTKLVGSTSARLLLAILVAAGSLYAGVFFAFNTFGT